MSESDRAGGWSHIDARGEARMVDVGSKSVTARTARAAARVRMREETRRQIVAGENPKGAVLTVARVAAIQAAKRTGELIPLCHPLPLEKVAVELSWDAAPPAGEAILLIETEVAVTAKTGVEMEALTAAAIAALTVYDMCKAVDRGMRVEAVELIEKTGGRSGRWKRG
jgi:cyclic pyranopterin phosphate synthase